MFVLHGPTAFAAPAKEIRVGDLIFLDGVWEYVYEVEILEHGRIWVGWEDCEEHGDPSMSDLFDPEEMLTLFRPK